MSMRYQPNDIAEVYCNGKRDLQSKSWGTSGVIWVKEKMHSFLKSKFSMASDIDSIASAERYLEEMGFTYFSITQFTDTVNDTIKSYLPVLIEDSNDFSRYTFSQNYYLGVHLDGQRLSEAVALELITNDIRSRLVVKFVESPRCFIPSPSPVVFL